MPLSIRSLTNLAGCHPDLLRLISAVNEIVPCEVICGFRGEVAQNQAFAEGKSDKKWPDGKHNKTLPSGEPYSDAADVVPLPINWDDKVKFYHFAGVVRAVSALKGIPIRWGGDWDSDFDLHDQNLYDLPHFERIGE
jgi:peptidoglycan L-alanyl-D-glutamate endopeptidase CwlK